MFGEPALNALNPPGTVTVLDPVLPSDPLRRQQRDGAYERQGSSRKRPSTHWLAAWLERVWRERLLAMQSFNSSLSTGAGSLRFPSPQAALLAA